MDPWEELGESIRTTFPHGRDLLPRAILYSADAAAQLPAALAPEVARREVVILADVRTRAVGAACIAAFRADGWTVHEQLVADAPDGSSPQCDDLTKAALAAQLPPAAALVAVGAGVINDLAKWLAGEAGLPYAVFATAASMNGYAAANVAPTIAGVKSLFRARAPRVIAADPRILRDAPARMTMAGLGDVIAKPVSTGDWLMNHRLFGEPYAAAVAGIINRVEPAYLDHPAELARGDASAVRGLFEALVYSGCAMTLQGSSLPASGGEHLVSHTLDMMAHVDGVAHDLHGRQVGVSTILVAAMYQRALALDAPVFTDACAPFDAAFWGDLAPSVAVEHAKKRANASRAQRLLSEPGRWAALRAELAAILPPPEKIKDCLRQAGAAHRIADLGFTRERYLAALHHCGAIRGRYTSIDLAWSLGILPAAGPELVDRWLLA
jgi:glycerol-1-phosphate dehydrogenase [NAD(P)+]